MKCGFCEIGEKEKKCCGRCGGDLCEFCRSKTDPTIHKNNCTRVSLKDDDQDYPDWKPTKNGSINRNFAFRDMKGNEICVFKGKQPRQAALKAANRGYTDIKLRERGTKKVHLFEGSRVQVDKPKGAPAWMADKIWKPIVKKVGIEKLEEL